MLFEIQEYHQQSQVLSSFINDYPGLERKSHFGCGKLKLMMAYAELAQPEDRIPWFFIGKGVPDDAGFPENSSDQQEIDPTFPCFTSSEGYDPVIHTIRIDLKDHEKVDIPTGRYIPELAHNQTRSLLDEIKNARSHNEEELGTERTIPIELPISLENVITPAPRSHAGNGKDAGKQKTKRKKVVDGARGVWNKITGKGGSEEKHDITSPSDKSDQEPPQDPNQPDDKNKAAASGSQGGANSLMSLLKFLKGFTGVVVHLHLPLSTTYFLPEHLKHLFWVLPVEAAKLSWFGRNLMVQYHRWNQPETSLEEFFSTTEIRAGFFEDSILDAWHLSYLNTLYLYEAKGAAIALSAVEGVYEKNKKEIDEFLVYLEKFSDIYANRELKKQRDIAHQKKIDAAENKLKDFVSLSQEEQVGSVLEMAEDSDIYHAYISDKKLRDIYSSLALSGFSSDAAEQKLRNKRTELITWLSKTKEYTYKALPFSEKIEELVSFHLNAEGKCELSEMKSELIYTGGKRVAGDDEFTDVYNENLEKFDAYMMHIVVASLREMIKRKDSKSLICIPPEFGLSLDVVKVCPAFNAMSDKEGEVTHKQLDDVLSECAYLHHNRFHQEYLSWSVEQRLENTLTVDESLDVIRGGRIDERKLAIRYASQVVERQILQRQIEGAASPEVFSQMTPREKDNEILKHQNVWFKEQRRILEKTLGRKNLVAFEHMSEEDRALKWYAHKINRKKECSMTPLRDHHFYYYLLDKSERDRISSVLAEAELAGFYKFLPEADFRAKLTCESQEVKRLTVMFGDCNAYKEAREKGTHRSVKQIGEIKEACKHERKIKIMQR
ncbi:hypothetical protein EOPP23_02640 [Endozoicomonas sp. OPT23]|nr:hypothetical protein [Endozoicomonas sp. OPT23]